MDIDRSHEASVRKTLDRNPRIAAIAEMRRQRAGELFVREALEASRDRVLPLVERELAGERITTEIMNSRSCLPGHCPTLSPNNAASDYSLP